MEPFERALAVVTAEEAADQYLERRRRKKRERERERRARIREQAAAAAAIAAAAQNTTSTTTSNVAVEMEVDTREALVSNSEKLREERLMNVEDQSAMSTYFLPLSQEQQRLPQLQLTAPPLQLHSRRKHSHVPEMIGDEEAATEDNTLVGTIRVLSSPPIRGRSTPNQNLASKSVSSPPKKKTKIFIERTPIHRPVNTDSTTEDPQFQIQSQPAKGGVSTSGVNSGIANNGANSGNKGGLSGEGGTSGQGTMQQRTIMSFFRPTSGIDIQKARSITPEASTSKNTKIGKQDEVEERRRRRRESEDGRRKSARAVAVIKRVNYYESSDDGGIEDEL